MDGVVVGRLRVLAHEHGREAPHPAHVLRDRRLGETQIVERQVAFAHVPPLAIEGVGEAEILVVAVVLEAPRISRSRSSTLSRKRLSGKSGAIQLSETKQSGIVAPHDFLYLFGGRSEKACRDGLTGVQSEYHPESSKWERRRLGAAVIFEKNGRRQQLPVGHGPEQQKGRET